jgi:uncharacterized protein (TIGR03437 family)
MSTTRLLGGVCFLMAFATLVNAQLSVVSSASQGSGVTADSLATVYGDHLASETVSASSLPWPTTLGDMPFVTITDSAGQLQSVPLIYVSPNQMNIWIPAGTAAGPATLAFPITGLPPGFGTAALRQLPFIVEQTAPALFSADGSGAGVAAATGVRVVIPTQIQSPVPVFQCVPAGCTAVGINLGVDTPVYVTLYGTGIRGASALSSVPLTLRAIGLTNVSATVDGVTSNAVQILIQ